MKKGIEKVKGFVEDNCDIIVGCLTIAVVGATGFCVGILVGKCKEADTVISMFAKNE